uniref:DUF4200 domain-containing protein n=1 Tax=Junco hyemalis TaxID=40217 RepID=A0A8C5IF21_JUNHY
MSPWLLPCLAKLHPFRAVPNSHPFPAPIPHLLLSLPCYPLPCPGYSGGPCRGGLGVPRWGWGPACPQDTAQLRSSLPGCRVSWGHAWQGAAGSRGGLHQLLHLCAEEDEGGAADGEGCGGDRGGEEAGTCLGGFAEWQGRRGVALAVAALSPQLWCCQAFAERMKTLAEQWRDLHARRAQLKAHENERLRTQALKKAKQEKVENSKKETELLRARRELDDLRKKHQKLSKKLLMYSPFKRYLEDVVENSQFRDIDDIISYYKALLRTRKDLLQSQWWHRQLMEQGKGLQQQLRAEKEAEMLQCRNDLVQLKESFDQAQSDIQQWEERWATVQDRQARKAVELRSLTMAIHSLFHTASTRLQPQGRVAAGDSHRQLDMVTISALS